MLNLLADVFRRAQGVTDKEFIAKLERVGIKYPVSRIEGRTYIEVGRFGSRGGGIVIGGLAIAMGALFGVAAWVRRRECQFFRVRWRSDDRGPKME